MTHDPGIKAVIFDIDGTILDTYEFVMHSFEEAVAAQGEKPDRAKIDSLLGQTIHETYPQLVPEEAVEAALQKHREVQALPEVRALISTFDQANEVLAALNHAGVRCAALSNRMHASLLELLEYTGLLQHFTVILGSDEACEPKPAPGGVRQICEILHVSAAEAVMIGDTPIDIKTAKNAGLRAAIGVTYGFGSREQLVAAGADFTLDSLRDFEEAMQRVEHGE
jgi:HAD superfamily hydrolase (TIGR01549 family)